MRILVAGGGAFGKEHLRTLSAIGGVTLAVAEMRSDELRRLETMFVLADRDADSVALLDRFAPDGLIVATPAVAHVELAIAALERHIPVLVEKPVAPDMAAMRLLCAAAQASRAFVQPGHILRFSLPHRQLRDVLRQGEIGRLLSFSSRRHRGEDHASAYSDIDPVLMTMIHDIDLALWFDGAAASAASAVRRPQGKARSLTEARLESESGAVWNLRTSWLHPAGDCPPDRVEIVGTEGSAEFTAGGEIEVHGAGRRRIMVDAADDPLRAELDCFLAGIRAGTTQAPLQLQDAVKGLLAVEMVLKAL